MTYPHKLYQFLRGNNRVLSGKALFETYPRDLYVTPLTPSTFTAFTILWACLKHIPIIPAASACVMDLSSDL